MSNTFIEIEELRNHTTPMIEASKSMPKNFQVHIPDTDRVLLCFVLDSGSRPFG